MRQRQPIVCDDSATMLAEIESRPYLPSSGATMTQLETTDPGQSALDRTSPKRFSYLRVAAIATMLPFATIEELFFPWRRYGVETANRYVIFAGEEVEELDEFPSVFALRPHRMTLLFPTNYPIPLLGHRSPFISPSSLVSEE